jgi:hypothetical protein
MHHAASVALEQPQLRVPTGGSDRAGGEGGGVGDADDEHVHIIGVHPPANALHRSLAGLCVRSADQLRGRRQVARVAAAVVRLVPAVERRAGGNVRLRRRRERARQRNFVVACYRGRARPACDAGVLLGSVRTAHRVEGRVVPYQPVSASNRVAVVARDSDVVDSRRATCQAARTVVDRGSAEIRVYSIVVEHHTLAFRIKEP